MGKSNSIEQQQKSNQEFKAYIDAMNKDMEEHVGKTSKEIDALVEAHYKPYPDKASLMEGRYSHLTTVSEWSLDSVQKMIGSCRDAIFGKPTPAGSKQGEATQNVSKAIQSLKNRELLIASAAFDVVQSLLGSFGTETSTDVMTKIDVKPLSPGLTLFIGVMANSYSHTSFFKNEKINQNMFVYKVFYSLDEGAKVSKLNDLEAYEEQKSAYRLNINKISDAVAELDVMSDDYLEQLTKFSARVTMLNDFLKQIDVKITELSSAKPMNVGGVEAISENLVLAECDNIVTTISNRWHAARAVQFSNQ